MSSGRFKMALQDIVANYRPFVVIATPIVLLPLLLCLRSPEADCGYAVLVMVVYWVSDALPLPVTGLLPVVLFPAIGIMGAKSVAKNYITDISLMLLGGIMTALAVEQSDFHRRLALRVLLFVGTRPTFILLGMMLPTWFLSMWISNTASAAMMLPIARAVVDQIGEGLLRGGTQGPRPPSSSASSSKRRSKSISANRVDATPATSNHHDNPQNDADRCHGDATCRTQVTNFGPEGSVALEMDETNDGQSKEEEEQEQSGAASPRFESDDQLKKRLDDFGKMLSLAVAYAATVGGTATLTGTPPNLVFQKYLNTLYESYGLPHPVSFSIWLFFGLPHAILCFGLTLAWLQLFFLGWRSFCFCCVSDQTSGSSEGIRKVIRAEYDSLGPIRFAEYSTLVLFLLLVLLWYIRDPGVFRGYSSLFKKGYVTDAVPAIFVAIFLFVFPAEVPRMFCLRKKGEGPKRFKPLLEWNDLCSRFPWGLLIILGGGFALAEACEVSGLSRVIGNQLQSLASLPLWVTVLLVVTIVALLTEVTSNTAIATIVIPILCQMAINVNVNPLYLTLPAAMATSYAFMLPVATGVNAVVFSYGNLSVLDMVKTGFVLNIACILIVTLGIHTWGRLVFNLDLLPWMASDINTNTSHATISFEKREH